MAKKLLITGGAGFIGSNFVHYISEKYPDFQIVVLDALTYAGSMDNLPRGMMEIDHPTMRFWYGNVVNAEIVDTLVEEVDYVVHFAAESHVTRSIFDNRLFFETDVLGTHTVSNAVLKHGSRVKRFIHISTSEVYGTAEADAMNEEHPLNPMSPYASAKCGADRLVYSYWKTYQIPCTIVRPFNNYGPQQHLEKVIPRFITSVNLGETISVHGDGSAARDFVNVHDVCRALDLILHAPADKVDGEVFNVASGADRSIYSIAEDIVDAMGANKSLIAYNGDRPGQVVRHTGDCTKIKRILGWEPEIDWPTGLRQAIDWYLNNREWWAKQIWMRHIPITTINGTIEYH